MSFSLETIHLMREGGISSINFAEWDVHPPIYYGLLYVWSYLNPGISEYYWAQELSVLFMLGFLTFAYLALTKFYKDKAGFIVLVLAMCSTYLHFGTEVRMYSLILFMSAVSLWAIVKDKVWIATMLAFFAFLVHYYSAAIMLAFFSMYLLVRAFRKESAKSDAVMFIISGIGGLLFALFTVAIPQRARVKGCWFQPPFITSWPDSLMYSFFMNEGGQFSFVLVIFYISFLALIFLVFKRGLKKLNNPDEAGVFHVVVLLGSLFSLVGLAAAPLLGGEGFAHLYHHRFFLVVTWMFAAVAINELTDWISERSPAIGAFFILLMFALVLFFLGYYCRNAHHELENLMVQTPCNGTQITIAHESPFSALPYEVYARENGCYWLNFVSTNQTPRMLNGGGGDAMKPGMIFYNKTLPADISYYYIYAEGTVPVDGERTIVAREDGVELWYINRSKALNCTDKITYYNNATEYQYTVVECLS